MNNKLAVAICGGAVAALALTGCGDGGEERQAWAKTFCSRIRPHVADIQQANEELAKSLEATADQPPEEVKKADSAAFKQLAEAYGTLATAVEEAEEPPVEDGAALRRQVVRELRDLSSTYTGLKRSVEKLKTKDQGEFGKGLEEIAQRLEPLRGRNVQSLKMLESGELGEAMRSQPDCRRSATPSQPDS